jgi:hypothetical protein
MAYIGRIPQVGNYFKLDAITTSSTATYNLLKGGVAYVPETAYHILVSLNGVIQSPIDAYTVSGSTITFASSLSGTDTINFILVLGDTLAIGTPSDGTVTDAKIVDVAATKLTGSIADARVPASAVTQHVTGYDDSAIRADIAALALREATNETSAAFNLPNSFIDTFTDDTNLGTQTNVDRVSGYIASVFTATTAFRYYQMYKTSSASGGGYHAEIQTYLDSTQHTITSGMLSQNDLQAWVPAQGIDNDTSTYIFHTDDADAGAYLRIDFGAGNEKIVNKFRTYVTNPASCTWNIQYSSDASSWTNATTGWVTDASTGSNQWKEVTFTSPSESSNNATGTLIQSANTLGSAKTEVSGTMIYKDNAGTATLGTDLKIYFTCNGGSNWTEAASYNAITPVYSSGIKQIRLGKTTCTSGTDVRYKAVWANQASGSKETQLHGIGINY